MILIKPLSHFPHKGELSALGLLAPLGCCAEFDGGQDEQKKRGQEDEGWRDEMGDEIGG